MQRPGSMRSNRSSPPDVVVNGRWIVRSKHCGWQASNSSSDFPNGWSTRLGSCGPSDREAAKLNTSDNQPGFDNPASRRHLGRRGGATAIPCPVTCPNPKTFKYHALEKRRRAVTSDQDLSSTQALSSCYEIFTTQVFAHFAGRNSGFLSGGTWQDSARGISRFLA
jgi:hypothetical protein